MCVYVRYTLFSDCLHLILSLIHIYMCIRDRPMNQSLIFIRRFCYRTVDAESELRSTETRRGSRLPARHRLAASLVCALVWAWVYLWRHEVERIQWISTVFAHLASCVHHGAQFGRPMSPRPWDRPTSDPSWLRLTLPAGLDSAKESRLEPSVKSKKKRVSVNNTKCCVKTRYLRTI